MKVSLIQMDSRSNKEENFSKAMNFFEKKALLDKPDILCLPERFLYWGDEKLEESENINLEKIINFRDFAKNNNVNLILGSIALKTETEN